MKKMLISSLLLSTVFLMAGGDFIPQSDCVSSQNDCHNNTVFVEKDTKLMWQDEAYTDAEDGAYKRERSSGKAGNRNHAMSYCNRLMYADHSDWRLPTSRELMHVHTEGDNPFVNFRGSDFWSSTPTVRNTYYVVYPIDAQPYPRKAKESNYIRCVRCMADEELKNL